ncbi:hypothetical protein NDU88_005869 [Pleurodeles waltl]|uniref:Uncharacterized protein n=1 Tax=Pleurodeles waltl TaxID=8319 RepID=A0AAV7SN35_PLEWA|nr:hypothetical protein NDU88_005869 [Pleurodeles waltl]
MAAKRPRVSEKKGEIAGTKCHRIGSAHSHMGTAGKDDSIKTWGAKGRPLDKDKWRATLTYPMVVETLDGKEPPSCGKRPRTAGSWPGDQEEQENPPHPGPRGTGTSQLPPLGKGQIKTYRLGRQMGIVGQGPE